MRRLLNEGSIAAALEPLGFEVVAAENLSFTEQVRLFAEAEIIVGAHGAGLANLIFAPPGTPVLELTHSRFRLGISSYDPLSQLFGMRLMVLVGAADEPAGRPVPERGENMDFRVHPEAVVETVRELLAA